MSVRCAILASLEVAPHGNSKVCFHDHSWQNGIASITAKTCGRVAIDLVQLQDLCRRGFCALPFKQVNAEGMQLLGFAETRFSAGPDLHNPPYYKLLSFRIVHMTFMQRSPAFCVQGIVLGHDDNQPAGHEACVQQYCEQQLQAA